MATGVWITYNKKYDDGSELSPESSMTPDKREVLYCEKWDKDGCHLSDGRIVELEWLESSYFQPNLDFMKHRLVPMLLKMLNGNLPNKA